MTDGESVVGEWRPIVPEGRKLTTTESGMIAFHIIPHQVSGEGKVFEAIEADQAGVSLLVISSPEAQQLGLLGQDRVGVADIGNSQLLLLLADGVGQSYLGEVAAGLSVSHLVKVGGNDLNNNLAVMGDYLSSFSGNLADAGLNRPGLLGDALHENWREGARSSTTLHQILVDVNSGKTKGLLHGDGELVIIRESGEVEMHPAGTASSQLNTNVGVVGSSEEFEVQLNENDVLIIASDGLDQLTKEDYEKLSHLSLSDMVDYLRNISSRLRDDDVSIIKYKHQGLS